MLSGLDLPLAAVAALAARSRWHVAPDAVTRMRASRAAVEHTVATGEARYGITTGFGAFANRRIPPHKVLELQANLVRSHACGVGAPLAARHVRRVLLLKANNLSAGFSGVRPEVVEAPPATSRRSRTWRSR
jgi:histidine ammonia-lyase